MSDIGKRIELLINHFGLNKNSFSREIGLSNNVTIGRIINEDNRTASRQTIDKILQRYPQINPSWLLTGEGNMLKDIGGTNVSINNSGSMTHHNNVGNAGNNIVNVSVPESGMQKIINPDGTVKIQSAGYAEDRIKHLEKMLEEKDKTIAALQAALESKKELIDTLKQIKK